MTATDMSEAEPAGGLDWLLDDLVDRTEHLRQAVLLSSDGLATAASAGLGTDDIDHLAALCSGFHSLAKGVGSHFGAGGVRQTMVMLEDAFLFVTPAGEGSCLAVLCDVQADVGQVAYEMSMLVKRVGRRLSTPVRAELRPAHG
ncbi:roadblock/LC7 domain-containing protein [Kitasatospora atroaurantiaca]|uniref:Putative regulator of Ras-like GTPase activity (Roadblock/LC7/MglB family) n=1 Tax=Kitasatospora atroaurantiaca TaxID=285545 RepID=A0A561EQY0_9ACTN|nr:roadblock/LC7 domain-containing protein [Kitasatospora atroaurantiaca]TWE18023.1 putative regulator of Ras-like GTPase activity (Roadblock/LC7/MglB family) [Kitasatospora atroaurantiaca]